MKLFDIEDPHLKSRHAQIQEHAIKLHRECGSRLAGYDYALHLGAVVNVGRQYLQLIPEPQQFPVMCALSAHDLMEDCRIKYDKIAKLTSVSTSMWSITGIDTANYVYNVTNELGRDRNESAQKTYPKIASCKYSTFVKLCDRITNLKFSYFMNDDRDKFAMYKAEHPGFFKALYNEEHKFDAMWNEIQKLVAY